MDLAKITTGVILVTIAVILAGVLVIPVVQDVTATDKTFTNEGYYSMDLIDESTSRVIEWDKSTPNSITIDGALFDMSWADANKSYTLIGSGEVIIRYVRGANNTAGLQMFSMTAGATYLSFHSGSSAETGSKATITLNAGSITFVTNGSSPLNKTISNIGTDAYVINPSDTGAYSLVMKKANVPAYLKGDSVIRFIGVSGASGPSGIALYGIGTIDDGMDLTTVYSSATVTDVSYSDPIPTDTEMSDFIGLYSLDKYEFTINYTDNGTPKTYDATYSYFIIPAEITAEYAHHMDATQILIIGLVPLLILVSVVMVAVRMISGRTD